MFDFNYSIPVEYYSPIYNLGIFILCLIVFFKYISSEDNSNIIKVQPLANPIAFGLSIILIFFIGLRPISGRYFVDMPVYAHTYNVILDGYNSAGDSDHGEWLFYWIGNLCKRLNFSDTDFFLLFSSLYFGLMSITCWRLMRRNLFVATLFCFISFSCYSFGVNGIRNGVASSIMMLAITFLDRRKRNIFIALLLIFASSSIHKAMTLTGICALISFLFIKDTKYSIIFWTLSIFISLIAGTYITQFFVDLGFDDRLSYYANIDDNNGEIRENINYNVGFRWDFIIYSIMPIIMVWYVTIRRNFKDNMFSIIANTYILSNAFWIMVIRSNQSNRFAYLSWFLYPLVIAYPLLRMNIWEDQDRKLAIILFIYSGFTIFMHFVYG